MGGLQGPERSNQMDRPGGEPGSSDAGAYPLLRIIRSLADPVHVPSGHRARERDKLDLCLPHGAARSGTTLQLISVERWIFWSAVVLAATEPWLSTNFGTLVIASTGDSIFLGSLVGGLVFILLLVSVGLGGSRDPSVRKAPTAPPS
jgi:hypothetical protein